MVASATDSAPAGRAHFPELDRLKALSIVAVVIIHSLRPLSSPQASALERAVAVVTQFAVPCFLMCSGWLYAHREARPLRVMGRRLARLLSAYAVAGVLAGIYQSQVLGQPVMWARDLLLGHTFGAYYYVFVITSLVLVVPVIAWLPGWLRVPLSFFLIASSSLRSVAPLLSIPPETTARLNFGLDPRFPWHLRHPLLVWGFFFFGWELRAASGFLRARLWGRPWPRRVSLAALACAWLAVAAFASAGDVRALRLISWPLIYLTLGALCLVTFGRTELTRGEAWLSRQTYFIYLYHLFFVFTAQRLWPQPTHGVSHLAWLAHAGAGLIGPCMLAGALSHSAPARVGRLLGVGVTPLPGGARL